MATPRLDLDGKSIKTMTICMIGAGGFIGPHLCEKLITKTPQTVRAVDVYNDKIKHLLNPEKEKQRDHHCWIHFHCLNIKHNSKLEDLIKISDLTIYLMAICTPADCHQVKYCSKNSKRLIHFSTCEVYGKTIGSF